MIIITGITIKIIIKVITMKIRKKNAEKGIIKYSIASKHLGKLG